MNALPDDIYQDFPVFIAHDHLMHSLAMHRSKGVQSVFATRFAPRLRQGGVKVVGLVVGGDAHPLRFGHLGAWGGTLHILDYLWQEAEESAADLAVCRSNQELDSALAQKKIAAFATLEGGGLLEESPLHDSLTALRHLYRLGVRSVQIKGEGWNNLAEAAADDWHSQGLSQNGVDAVLEMARLGMVIDLACVPDPDPLFWNVLEVYNGPVIDSHRALRGVNPLAANLSDERLRAISRCGGVVGLNFHSFRLAPPGSRSATIDHVVRHIDHAVQTVGIDAIGLGPDFTDPELFQHQPDFYPVGLEDITRLPNLTEALIRRGYNETDILKVLGQNFLRVYRQVLK